MEDLTGEAPGQWSQLTFSQHLNQWINLRNALAHGRNWEPEEFRLPASWFEPGLPEEFRGATRDGYAHWSLWGGRKLYRRES